MNTQLVEQPKEQVLPMHEALALVQTAFKADIEQNNLMVDELERFGNENTFLKLQMQNITARVNGVTDENKQLKNTVNEFEEQFKTIAKQKDMVLLNAEKHMQMLSQAQRQEQQAQNKLADSLEREKNWKTFSSSPKKAREQRKGYQETIKKHQSAETQCKIEIKNYRFELTAKEKEIMALNRQVDELDFTKIYSENGDNLAIYSLLCEVSLGQSAEKQVPIWYMTDDGIGALYMLNEDGEPARAAAPKTGIKPKKETMELIGTLLRKFKRNGNVVHPEDIKLLESK